MEASSKSLHVSYIRRGTAPMPSDIFANFDFLKRPIFYVDMQILYISRDIIFPDLTCYS